MRELLTLAEREMHEQAIAYAWIWRRPHTQFVVGRMPVTYFKDYLPGMRVELVWNGAL